MADVLTKAQRSQIMSKVRGRGNESTELALLEIFRSQHITGWRRQQPLFGKPDFVFHKLRLAIFIDGCFWHNCPLHGRQPKSHRSFWRNKLETNKARDRLVTRTLRRSGWQVFRIWEHNLAPKFRTKFLKHLNKALADSL